MQHENMISASVEVVGAVCRKLTWSKYLYYLKHFIHILQTAQAEQKLAVRSGFCLSLFCEVMSFSLINAFFSDSLLVTVLEAFHFDHKTLSREMEAAKAREAGSIAIDADNEDEAAAIESDASDGEEAMETDAQDASADIARERADEEKDVSEKSATIKAKVQTAPTLPAAASGLPQSREELESLIRATHQTVNDTVLPRLHKCLTAKVRSHTCYNVF